MNYLLPCTCGQKIPIEPRRAGETVQCPCGLTQQAPTLREIRQLPRAVDESPPAARREVAWGARQRLLMAGTIVVVIAVVLALLIAQLRPSAPYSVAKPELMAAKVRASSLVDSVRFYHRYLEPGLERGISPEEQDYARKREQFQIGMVVLGVLGAFGLALMLLGIAGVGSRALDLNRK